MHSTRHQEMLASEGEALVALVAASDPSWPVPSCPAWTLSDLALHVGRLYRWAAALVAGRVLAERWSSQLGIVAPSVPMGADELSVYLADGLGEFLRVVHGADVDDACWGWGADQHVRFWPRRMLFETAVHRADAVLASGERPSLDGELGAEGIDEHLENLPATARFGGGLDELRGPRRTLGVVTEAGSWRITMSERALVWDRGEEPTDVTLLGPPGACYLALLGRIGIDDESVHVEGNVGLLRLFVRATAF